MHAIFVRRAFYHLTAALFIVLALISVSSGQSAGISPASAVGATKDFSLSIEPKSVVDFSDQQLDETYARMSSQYSKNAVLFNNIGATYYNRKAYDKSEAAIKRAIMLNNHPAFLTNLSIVYETLERIPEAISAAQRAVAQAPRYPRARMQLCELIVYTKRNNDALTCYGEYAKFASLDAQSQSLLALTHVRMGNNDKAIAIVAPLIRTGPATVLMYNVLGFAYFQKKRYPQAIESFKLGVELDPDSPNLRYNLAMALTANDNRIGAISQYNLVKEKDPQMAEKLYRNLYRDKIIYVNDAVNAKQP
jgi:tetratricopeptide (TPR) repeat protein